MKRIFDKSDRLYFYAFILFFLISCKEKISSRFQNYNEMKGSESYKNGWIPDVIPSEAIDIYEVHDLDTNDVFIKFYCQSELNSKSLKLRNDFVLSRNKIGFMKRFVKDDFGDMNKNLSSYGFLGTDSFGQKRIGHLFRLKSHRFCFYFDGVD